MRRVFHIIAILMLFSIPTAAMAGDIPDPRTQKLPSITAWSSICWEIMNCPR